MSRKTQLSEAAVEQRLFYLRKSDFNEDFNEVKYVFFKHEEFNAFESSVLRECMLEVLEDFRRCQGRLPEKIVVFRKGESEGQKDSIRQDEVSGCWEAFQEIDENWEPSLFTYIMWTKHSGIRFSTTDDKNPPPRTLVQGGVTSQWQFSLQSHQTTLAAINAPLYTIINAPQMLEKKNKEPVEVPHDRDPENPWMIELPLLTLRLSALYVNYSGMHPVPAIARFAFDAAKKIGECSMSPDQFGRFKELVREDNQRPGSRPNYYL